MALCFQMSHIRCSSKPKVAVVSGNMDMLKWGLPKQKDIPRRLCDVIYSNYSWNVLKDKRWLFLTAFSKRLTCRCSQSPSLKQQLNKTHGTKACRQVRDKNTRRPGWLRTFKNRIPIRGNVIIPMTQRVLHHV